MPYSAKQVAALQVERNKSRYVGMDNAAFLVSVTLVDIPIPRDTNAAEVFEAFEVGDLPVQGSAMWDRLMMIGTFNAANDFKMDGNVRLILQSVFGSNTQTRANLVALATENKSPAQIAGLPVPILADISRTS